MGEKAATKWIAIRTPVILKHREIGTQQRLSFEVPVEFEGMTAYLIAGANVKSSEELFMAADWSWFNTVTVGRGRDDVRGRIRAIMPDNLRGSTLYVVVA